MPDIDRLEYLLALQSNLQASMPTGSPESLLPNDPIAAIEFISWNVLAAEDELHELLGETGWKPWATSKHVNLTAARSELIDVMHFVFNLALVLGLDADDIVRLYETKHHKNRARQEAGYDGVATKCPGCHRALDDVGVACHTEPDFRLGGPVYPVVVVCAKHGRVYPISDPYTPEELEDTDV